jgi:hypothetical protein
VVVGLCVWLLLIEGLLFGDVPAVAKFVPGASAGALAGAVENMKATDLLAPGLGLVLLAAYAATSGVVGSVATRRRDVN